MKTATFWEADANRKARSANSALYYKNLLSYGSTLSTSPLRTYHRYPSTSV